MSFLKKLSRSPPTSFPEENEEPDGIDPDLRLRIVRTATESIHEAAREDARRRVNKVKRARGRSIFGTIKKRSTSISKHFGDHEKLGADNVPSSQLPRAPSRLVGCPFIVA